MRHGSLGFRHPLTVSTFMAFKVFFSQVKIDCLKFSKPPYKHPQYQKVVSRRYTVLSVISRHHWCKKTFQLLSLPFGKLIFSGLFLTSRVFFMSFSVVVRVVKLFQTKRDNKKTEKEINFTICEPRLQDLYLLLTSPTIRDKPCGRGCTMLKITTTIKILVKKNKFLFIFSLQKTI